MRKLSELESEIGMRPHEMRRLFVKGAWDCVVDKKVRSKHAEDVARWRAKRKSK